VNGSFAERGGWWVLGQFAIMPAVIASPWIARHQWPAMFSNIVGGLLIASGAALGIAGARALGKNRTAFPAPVTTGTLVCTGAYRLVRHPLYGSLMLLAAGWALLWQSYPALGSAFAMALFLHMKAVREEALLRSRYLNYAEYAKHVKRFIPGIW
jgi:protein-S-isoprenylcysteine O-methyltransferase Ste14